MRQTPATGRAASTAARPRPEVLAPAGDFDCVRAAVENGADAVYFGVQKYNARARARNFPIEELPDLLAFLHLRGVRGYVTFNTLLFANELDEAAATLERLIAAGPDALILQDLGVARLAREISSDVPLHASTQTTTTCAESMGLLEELGFSRVILARELSVADIRKIHDATPMGLETFVHGALCVAYSGQCLTSEALGGRSANRGACAQACRLPYDLIVDGQTRDLGDRKYLISPQDLSAVTLVPELAGLVCSLKIEGRLKSPEYVAATTAAYRRAVDMLDGAQSRDERLALEQVFSRGLSHGFLGGVNHQVLVPGLSPKKRGIHLGRVSAVRGARARITLEAPLAVGDGIVFDYGRPEDQEPGGRVMHIFAGLARVARAQEPETVEIEVHGVHGTQVGWRVWKTDDPRADKALRATFERTRRRIAVDAHVQERDGRLEVTLDDGMHRVRGTTGPVEPARRRPLTAEFLRGQLGRLGDTPFELRDLTADLGAVMVPVSQINALRRDLARDLETIRRANPGHAVHAGGLERLRGTEGQLTASDGPACAQADGRAALARALVDSAPESGPTASLHSPAGGSAAAAGQTQEELPPMAREPVAPASRDPDGAELVVLCRSLDQVEVALEEGVRSIVCDFEDIRRYRDAVARVRAAGRTVSIALAPPRILKPGEAGFVRALVSAQPDAILVRSLAHLAILREEAPGLTLLGDFSLNVANDLTAGWLFSHGLARLVPSYDLNAEQLAALLERMDASRVEIVAHHHMPMFHNEHCVFAALLSNGKDHTDCGRPCDRHSVALRDWSGAVHPVKADAGCRNTVFNAVPQSASPYVRRLQSLGVGWFRVELLVEDAAQARTLVRRYQDLLTGRAAPETVWRALHASTVMGVTRGPLGRPE